MINVKCYRKFLVLGLIFFATGGVAKEWYLEPTIKLNSEYDDNPQLRTQDIQDAYGVIANLGAEYGVRSEIYNISSSTLVDIYRYWGHKNLNLDRDNVYTDLNADYSLTERNKLGLNAGYRSDTSLTSESSLTGVVQNQIGREVITVAPSWSYLLSESKTLKASYNHDDIVYEKNNNNLRSYNLNSVFLGLYDQWTPRTQYFITTSALRFQLRDKASTTDNLSLNVGFEHKYSETLKFNAMAGGRYTEVEVKAPNRDRTNSIGWLLALGVTKQFEVGSFNINYARSTSPTGVGIFMQSDTFDGHAEYKLSERFKAMLSGSVIMTSSTSSDKNYDRSYYTVEPELGWEMTRQAMLVGGYRYRSQQYDQSNASQLSNAVFLYVDYQWDKFASNGDSQFLSNLIARIQEPLAPKIEQPIMNTRSRETLLAAFFTRQKVDALVNNYSVRFRNALYFHYAKYIVKKV